MAAAAAEAAGVGALPAAGVAEGAAVGGVATATQVRLADSAGTDGAAAAVAVVDGECFYFTLLTLHTIIILLELSISFTTAITR